MKFKSLLLLLGAASLLLTGPVSSVPQNFHTSVYLVCSGFVRFHCGDFIFLKDFIEYDPELWKNVPNSLTSRTNQKSLEWK